MAHEHHPISIGSKLPPKDSIVDPTPCAYGFIDGPEPRDGEDDSTDGSWAVLAQRPFRAHYLWGWAEPGAVLRSLCLHEDEQLVTPEGMGLPFEAFERLSVTPNDFVAYAVSLQHTIRSAPRIIEPHQRLDGGRSALMQFEGTPLDPRIDLLCRIRPAITLPAIPAGATIHLEFTGRVRGLLLVGEQVR